MNVTANYDIIGKLGGFVFQLQNHWVFKGFNCKKYLLAVSLQNHWVALFFICKTTGRL